MLLRIMVLLSVVVGAIQAQTETGVITGTVTDASGGAVAGARIAATNRSTHLVYEVLTNSSGIYVIPALPIGTYDLTATGTGFSVQVQKNIVVDVQSRRAVDFQLTVGAVNETIEVQAAAPLLESETSSVGQVITTRSIVDLPLNGRNYAQLATLAPGAVPNPRSRATDSFSLNGARAFQTQFLLDGVDNNNTILGNDTASTEVIRPSPDAIQEFKLESANYSAEFGRAQGGVVIASIRSGSDAFHGSAFEFLRNDKLDATDFFANKAGQKKPPLRQSQFGGTVGGPIRKEHTFFFLSYQGTRASTSQTLGTTVPTAGQAAGNFGGTPVFDPLNVVNGVRQQFPGNVVPANRIDPVGAKLAALYPRPNAGGAVNYFANRANTDNENEADARIDHRISSRDSVFGRLSIFRKELDQGSFFAPPGNGGNGFTDYPVDQLPEGMSLAFNHTHIFGPAIVNEFRAGYTRNRSDQLSPSSQPLFQQFGINGVPLLPNLNGLPQIAVAGFSGLGDRTFLPNPKLTQVRQFMDSLSILHGKHSIKAGTDIRFDQNYAGTSNSARGTFDFNGQFTRQGANTGSAVADLLLGQTDTATLTTPLVGSFRDRSYNFFVQDDWKVRRNLTLNLGLRYELQTPRWEHWNHMSDIVLDPASPKYAQLAPAGTEGTLGRTFSNLEKTNFAPRVGFAYQATPRTVIRGGAGIFYGGFGYTSIGNSLAANPPFYISVSFPSASTAARSVLPVSQGYPENALDPVNNSLNPALQAIIPHNPRPRTAQWNIGIQREIGPNNVFSLTYVGSGTSYLPGLVNYNQPVPGPGAVNPRRPFPQYGDITLLTAFAHSTYDGLQARFERRFSRGWTILSAYTWSKTIDNSASGEDFVTVQTTPQNGRDWRSEKGVASFDVTHRWVTSTIYEIPIGAGHTLLAQNRAARWILGNWQAGGILTLSTGVPFSPTIASNVTNTVGTIRPDRIGDGNLPRGERTPDRWFDPAAFRLPEAFTFGNAGRDVLRAPGLANLDFLAQRNFPFGEQRRVEFRAEFYNLTNSPHFSFPNTNIDLRQGGAIPSLALPGRQIQLGLRVQF